MVVNTERLASWMDQAQPILVAFGLKALGAIAVFIVGRWLIGMATRLVGAAMTRQRLDPTVQRYWSASLRSPSTSSWWLPSSATSAWKQLPLPHWSQV